MTKRRPSRAPRSEARGSPLAPSGRTQGPPAPAAEAAGDTPSSRRVAGSRAVPVGRVTHYFARARAALVALEEPLAVGDLVHLRGATTDLVQEVARLERAGRSVRRGRRGEQIGLAVSEPVRPADRVFRLDPPAP